jgi:hypothetical protein
VLPGGALQIVGQLLLLLRRVGKQKCGAQRLDLVALRAADEALI